MKPHQLKAFLMVAEQRSIRAAAKCLFVSQPAVTRTLRELEADLGVPLVLRSAKGIELTEYGRAFVRRAQLLVSESQRAREELTQMKKGTQARLTFAASTIPSLTLLPAALTSFSLAMPGARVECQDGQLPLALPALREGRLDFLLGQMGVGAAAEDLCVEPLFSCNLAVVARHGHPRIRVRKLESLVNETWMGWDERMIPDLFQSCDLQVPRNVIISNSLVVTRVMVEKTDVISLFAHPALNTSWFGQGVKALPIREKLPQMDVSIVTRIGSILTPAATEFLGIVRRVCSDLGFKAVRPPLYRLGSTQPARGK